MATILTGATIVTLLLLVPFIGRAIAGPTIFDRVVALNGMGTMVPVILVLIGLRYGRGDMFIDMAVALFLLNLFLTLLIARYVRDTVVES